MAVCSLYQIRGYLCSSTPTGCQCKILCVQRWPGSLAIWADNSITNQNRSRTMFESCDTNEMRCSFIRSMQDLDPFEGPIKKHRLSAFNTRPASANSATRVSSSFFPLQPPIAQKTQSHPQIVNSWAKNCRTARKRRGLQTHPCLTLQVMLNFCFRLDDLITPKCQLRNHPYKLWNFLFKQALPKCWAMNTVKCFWQIEA